MKKRPAVVYTCALLFSPCVHSSLTVFRKQFIRYLTRVETISLHLVTVQLFMEIVNRIEKKEEKIM